jgi:hypothetical protein
VHRVRSQDFWLQNHSDNDVVFSKEVAIRPLAKRVAESK